MRLIDADKLIEQLREVDDEIVKGCIGVIQTQPTAYDLEAVVAELEEMKCYESGCFGVSCGKCKYNKSCLEGEEAFRVALDNAIEIVRNGGKE